MAWSPHLPPRPPNADELHTDVLEEHLEEGEFLLEQCERLLESPDYDATELATLPEERLRAHVDGLILGGPVAVDELLKPAIEGAETVHGAAVALIALLDHPVVGLGNAALDGLAEGDRDYAAAMRLAAAWALRPDLDERLTQRLSRAKGAEVQGLLEVAAARGTDPGARIGAFLRESELAGAAVGAAAFSSDAAAKAAVEAHTANPDPDVAALAIEVGIGLCSKPSWIAAQRGAMARSRTTLQYVASFGDPRQHEWLIGLLAEDEHRADALWALGFSGSPAAADACLDHMEDEATSKLAGEAFRAITGLPYDQDEFWFEAKEPEEEDPGGEEVLALVDDDLDADLVPTGEDELMTPDPAFVRPWWSSQRSRFDDKIRYLYGKPFTDAALRALLREGCSMRRRHVLAVELAARAQQHLPTRCSAARQLQLLADLPATPTDFQRPWTRWR